MSPLDKQIITRKCTLIQKDLERLKDYQNLSLQEFIESFDTQLITQRLLEMIIGRLLDINYHLLSQKHQFVPQDYKQSFVEMGKKGEVDFKLANDLSNSAGLRNVLVHEYDEIDPKKVHQAIETTLTQVPPYLKQILNNLS